MDQVEYDEVTGFVPLCLEDLVPCRPSSKEEANLVSSLWDDGLHRPTLDIDRMAVTVTESSTPGNYHLVIDKPMSQDKYQVLLAVLADVGIIEENVYRAAKYRGFTALRYNCKKGQYLALEEAK